MGRQAGGLTRYVVPFDDIVNWVGCYGTLVIYR